jgi:hypothetical protein
MVNLADSSPGQPVHLFCLTAQVSAALSPRVIWNPHKAKSSSHPPLTSKSTQNSLQPRRPSSTPSTHLQDGFQQAARQARQGDPCPRPHRYVPTLRTRKMFYSAPLRTNSRSAGVSLIAPPNRPEIQNAIELAQFLRVERVLICGFRGLQAPVVVSPRSASSSWTIPPVPSSVTSRAQVCDSEFVLRFRIPKKKRYPMGRIIQEEGKAWNWNY